MRSGTRAVGVLAGIAFRVDPMRTVLVLLLMPILGGATALSGIAVRWLIDTAVARDGTAVLRVAAFFTLTILIVYQMGVICGEIKLALQTKVAHEIDRRAMTLCTGLPSIEHHENPAYLDRLELLRHRRAELGGAFGAMVENLRALVGTRRGRGAAGDRPPHVGRPAAGGGANRARQSVPGTTRRRCRPGDCRGSPGR